MRPIAHPGGEVLRVRKIVYEYDITLGSTLGQIVDYFKNFSGTSTLQRNEPESSFAAIKLRRGQKSNMHALKNRQNSSHLKYS